VLGPSLTPEIVIRQTYSNVDLRLRGDRAKLNQLFWNLLQNSVTALNGRGVIQIDAGRQGDRIEVAVSDDGVGIPEDRVQEVFEFGFTQKNGRVGLRLGLPTSKLTVEEHGGEIAIDSVPGRGTSVRLYLPVEPAGSGPASRPPSSRGPSSRSPISGSPILSSPASSPPVSSGILAEDPALGADSTVVAAQGLR
jgi:K+-sensing histidine kinase KdpD